MKPIQISLSARAPLSDLQKEYRAFIRKVLKEKGMESLFEDKDQIADLFGEISERWSEYKAEQGLTTKAEQEEGGR